MTDRDLIDALDSGQVSGQCPCGVPKTAAPVFHRSSTDHDCMRHPRYRCWTCKAADRMVAAIEARLVAEAMYGPFVLTRQEMER